MNIHTAKRTSRLLVKSLPTRRKSLHDASKAEERGTSGAREERLRLTKRFKDDVDAANASVAETRRVSRDFDRAHHILRFDPHAEPLGPVSSLAIWARRLGAGDDALMGLCRDTHTRADEAADVAEARLDAADADLTSTAHLAAYLDVLAKHRFDPKRKQVREAHAAYQHFKRMT